MTNTKSLPKLPSLKNLNLKCQCGCGNPTTNRFAIGHDSKLLGRVRRVKAGVFDQTNPTDETAQLDAAMMYLTIGEVEALAKAIGSDWTEEAWTAREEAADATGTGN